MHLAIERAVELWMDCVQVFTKNQRQWHAPPLKDEHVEAWLEAQDASKLQGYISHDSYLINLASHDPTMRGKSIDLFREELVRCDRLRIPLLVTHPGAHLGEGEEAGLRRVAEALNRLHEQLPDVKVTTLLEVTAGQGTSLGHRLEHLAWLIEHVEAGDRLGVCLDTAHLLAAGYDLTSGDGARRVLTEIDATVGLDRVRAAHINDSKVERGKRVDRHAHIGHGHVSMEAFRVLVNHPKLRNMPKILETPKEKDEHGRDWDAVNLEVLRELVNE